MIPLVGYTAAGALAAGLAIGGWIGADWIGAKEYGKGLADGAASQKKIHALEIATLQADSRAQAQTALREATNRAREIERIQQAAIEAGRVERVQALATVADELRRLRDRERLRNADAARGAVRPADGGGRVPAAAADAARTEGSATEAAWMVSAGSRERLIRLGAEAERINADLALCLARSPGLEVKADRPD